MRVAINGFGRIGRCLLRAAYERSLLNKKALEIVAINEVATADTIAYLTQYDSTHGRFPASVSTYKKESGHYLNVNGPLGESEALLISEADVHQLPWHELDVDWVFECTGEIFTNDQAGGHLQSGAKGVLLSNPGEHDIPVAMLGLSDSLFDKTPAVISAASCTSNALLPAVATLHNHFGIESGVITTIHAAMHDQPVIDAYHGSDLRKNRASSQSFIPVQTELAAGVGRVLPELAGRFVAHAIRVPVNNVSALNVTLNLSSDVTASLINRTLAEASEALPKNVLAITNEPLASCDFVHHPVSGTIDAAQTQVVNKRSVNLLIWFDNEWAFVNRMLDIVLRIQASN